MTLQVEFETVVYSKEKGLRSYVEAVNPDPLKVSFEFLAICDMNIKRLNDIVKVHNQALVELLEEKGELENKMSTNNETFYLINISIPLRMEVIEGRLQELKSWIAQIRYETKEKAHQNKVKKAEAKGLPIPKRTFKKRIEAKDLRHIPIDRFITLPSSNSICCLWHQERTPSLHYYKKDNKLQCFGQCGRGYDVIDVVMKKQNLNFKQALQFLQEYL